jgi:hypothetical protein
LTNKSYHMLHNDTFTSHTRWYNYIFHVPFFWNAAILSLTLVPLDATTVAALTGVLVVPFVDEVELTAGGLLLLLVVDDDDDDELEAGVVGLLLLFDGEVDFADADVVVVVDLAAGGGGGAEELDEFEAEPGFAGVGGGADEDELLPPPPNNEPNHELAEDDSFGASFIAGEAAAGTGTAAVPTTSASETLGNELR